MSSFDSAPVSGTQPLIPTQFVASTTRREKLSRIGNLFLLCAFVAGVCAGKELIGSVVYARYLINALAMRKVAQTLIGLIGYPRAILTLLKRPAYTLRDLRQEPRATLRAIPTWIRSSIFGSAPCTLHSNEQELVKAGYQIEKITLYKSGIAYQATAVTHKENDSKKWSLHAQGNCDAFEDVMESAAEEDHGEYQCNSLFINGPAVGESGGLPTRYQLGAGFEAGLQFLKKQKQASHIAMNGFSLGGGMLSEAILHHDFTDAKASYLLVSDRTFNWFSTIAGELVGRGGILGKIVTGICLLVGTELDGVGGAKKITQLNYKHIIVHHAMESANKTDGVITDHGSLRTGIEDAANRTFITGPGIEHNALLPRAVEAELVKQKKAFFGVGVN